MNKQLKIISSLLLLFLLIIPSIALSQTAVGKFTHVEGRVDVLRPPATRAVPVKMGYAVFVGDIIRAKSKSKAEITFTDGNIVRVAPSTRVEISEYMFEETKGKGILKLSRGKVQAIIQEKIAKRIATFGEANRFEIHTPTAIAGARGCNFIVFFQRNWSGVLVLDGTVQTCNPKFPDAVQTVTAGNISIILQDQPAQPSRPATDAEMKGYVVDTPAPPDTGGPAPGLSGPGVTVTEIVQPPPITEMQPQLFESPSDTTPPIISIDLSASPEAGPEAALNIAFSSNEPVTFSYKVDDGPWTPVTSPFSIPDISEGPHVLQFKVTDPAGNTNTTPAFPFELSRYTLKGSATGTGSILTGSVTEGEVAGILNQSWGGWSISMSGSHKGSSGSSWQTVSGGTGYDSDGYSNGYWIDKANGKYSGTTMTGTSQLTYITTDTLGTGIGTVNGTFGGDTWQATDIGTGTYTEKPLIFSGDWGGHSLYYNKEGYFWYAGYEYGLIGLALRPDNNYDLLAIGEYYDDGDSTAYLWNSPIYANSVKEDKQGRVYGFSGGICKDETINGAAFALYIDHLGNAGYLISNVVSGSYYPELENPILETLPMWMAEGVLVPTQRATGLNPEDLPKWGYLDAHLVGDFDGIGSVEGWTGGDYAYGETLFFVKDSEGLPWGIYDLKLGFGNTFSDKPAGTTNWSAMIGGEGTFGYEDDDGYWLAKVEGTWTDEGEIRGDLINGKYLTLTQMGTVGGPFFGINCHSKVLETWIGESIGTWSGEALAFGGSTSGEFMYWDIEGMSGDGWIYGLMGERTSLFLGFNPETNTYSPAPFLSLGTYGNTGNSTLWAMDIGTEGTSGWTSDEGAFIGSIGGIALNENLEGLAIGLYIRPTETEGEYEAGYIYSDNAIGTLYPRIEMYELGGNLTTVSIDTTTISPSELYWGSESLNSGEDYGLMTGDVTGSIVIESANLADQNWGVWRAGSGGTYNITPSESWTAYAEGESYDMGWNIIGIWGSQTIGSRIDTDKKLIGETTGYFADISSIPVTGISVGETLGTFNPNDYTWQAIQMGAWIETKKFLQMTTTQDGIAKLNQLNIPCFEVGRASLSGSGSSEGGSIYVNMNDVIFFAPNTGRQPSIWATNSVGGTYTGNPLNAEVTLSGGGLNANFHVQQWNTDNNVWLSRIQNGQGTLNRVDMPGTVTINNFQGAAAGTMNQEKRTFSGTGAGTAR